jgi:hypothetical protein
LQLSLATGILAAVKSWYFSSTSAPRIFIYQPEVGRLWRCRQALGIRYPFFITGRKQYRNCGYREYRFQMAHVFYPIYQSGNK